VFEVEDIFRYVCKEEDIVQELLLDSESEDELRPMPVTETTHSGLTPPAGWKPDAFFTGSRNGGSAGVQCVHREEVVE
jgi:hypothetical protein